MTSFAEVVEQLKADNRSEAGRDSTHTREMRLTRDTLENLTSETIALRENTSATQEAVISQTDDQLTPSQIEENNKETNANNEKTNTLLSKIAGGIGGIYESGKKAAAATGKGLLKVLQGTLLAGLFIGVAKFLQSETFQKILDFLFDTVIPALKDFYDNVIVPVGEAILEFFNTTVKPALIGIKDFFMQDVFPFLKDLIVNDIMPFVKRVYNDIIEPSLTALKDFFMQDVFPALKTFIKDDVIPFINDVYENVIKPAFDAVKEFITNEVFPAIGRFFEKIGELYDKLKPKLDELFTFLKETTLPVLFETIKKNFEVLKDIFGKIGDFISNIIDGDFGAAFDDLKDIGGLIVKAIDNAISGILKMFGLEFEGNVSDVIGRFFDSIFNKIDTAINNVLQSVENIIRAIPGGGVIADKLFGELTATEKTEKELDELREEIAEQQKEIAAGDLTAGIGSGFAKREDIIAEKEKRIAEIEREQAMRLAAEETSDAQAAQIAAKKRENYERKVAKIEKKKEDLRTAPRAREITENQNPADQMNENNIQQKLRGGGPPNLNIVNAPQTVASSPQTNNYSTPSTTIVNTDPVLQAAMS